MNGILEQQWQWKQEYVFQYLWKSHQYVLKIKTNANFYKTFQKNILFHC